MTKNFKIYFFLSLVLVRWFSQAWAQGSPISLDDVFQAAIHKSEVVKDQEELVFQADETHQQALGSILPSITGTASYFQQENGYAFSTSTQKQIKLSGDQPLFRGFREYAGLTQTEVLANAQRQSKKLAQVQLYQQVLADFYQVLAAEKDIANLKEESRMYEKRIDELNARVRIGRSRPAEVTQIQASLESLRATLEASKDQLSTARKSFSFLTGLTETTAIQDPFADNFAPEIEPLDHYLSAIDRRPEVQNAFLKRDAADEGIRIARGAHLPSVDLMGDYYLSRVGGAPTGNWDFQLALTLPIYAGGTIQSKVRQAASQYQESELSLSRGERLADQEIRTYHSRFQADRLEVLTLQRAKDFSWTNYQQETRDYRLGLVTNLDVLQSLTAFEESERALDRAKFQQKTDYLYLLSASGKLKIPEVAF